MANESAVRKPESEFPLARDLNLDDYTNQRFTLTRSGGRVTRVYLVSARRGRVTVKESLDRTDSLTLSVAEFGKFRLDPQ